MKKRLLFLLISGHFLAQQASAQKNMVSLDLHYLPVSGSNLMGGTIGYFRSVCSRRSIGFKAVCNTDAVGKPSTENRYWALAFDLTHRYKLSNNKKANFYGSLGLSALVDIYRRAPSHYMHDWNVTEEVRLASIEYVSHWHTETNYYPGIGSGLDMEISISPAFSIGASLILNAYVDFDCLEVYPAPLPSLHSAYYF